MENLKKFVSFIFSSIIVYVLSFPLSINTNASANQGFGYAPAPNNVPTSLEPALINIINYILGFVAVIATLIMIYGGFVYLTSLGNDDRRAQAQKIIAAGIIGIIIIGLAYALVITTINIVKYQGTTT